MEAIHEIDKENLKQLVTVNHIATQYDNKAVEKFIKSMDRKTEVPSSMIKERKK